MSVTPWLSMEADSGGTLPDIGSTAWAACAAAPYRARVRIGAMTITEYLAVNAAVLACLQEYAETHKAGGCGCEGSGDAR